MRETITHIAGLVIELLRGPRATLPTLEHSIAAAAAAHGAARRALAITVAEERREIERRTAMTVQVDDLEERAVQAIRAGRDDLALAASETIAAIRTEIEASQKASAHFAAEVVLARGEVNAQRRRLLELDRGRRIAAVNQALNAESAISGLDRFAEAEQALARVNIENANARAVREEMTPSSERLTELMASEGFGRPVAVRAVDVMARLRAMAQAPILIEPTARP
jgi:phage shock protein A